MEAESPPPQSWRLVALLDQILSNVEKMVPRGRRNRIEWPSMDFFLLPSLGAKTPNTPIPPSVKTLLDRELSLCDTNEGYVPDLGVYDETRTSNPNWKVILRNLYWRARRQSAVWDVYELLVDRGFVDPQSL